VTHIKICGIKDEAHALALAETGIDFMGLVFASSPRQVTRSHARKIVAAIKRTKSSPEIVGVFVNTPAPTITETAEKCNLDWVQLSGDEPWSLCREINLPIIKVIRVSRNKKPEQIINDLEYGRKLLAKQKHIFLLDANAREKYGGSGMKFDWKLAVPVAKRLPVIIAGGLTPANVAEAIKLIRPWGVDVSSGVETKGAKDMSKITKFIENVRKADDDNS
jgi:phosphoribosylanthranilate isomerase